MVLPSLSRWSADGFCYSTDSDRYNVTSRFLTPVDPTDPVQVQEREKQLRSWAFQSTHFGAELVWTGDFVRLFEADGTLFEGIQYESPPTSLGQRAMFLKVFAIYKVNSGVDEPGLVKLAGELWELRDFASTTTTTTAAAASSVAQASSGGGVAAAAPGGSGAEIAVTAADGQSAMSMFEKRPSPVRVNGPPPPPPPPASSSSSLTPAVIAGTPSTPPDTPPARGLVPSVAAAAAVGGGEEGPARDGPAKVSPAAVATFDPEALNLPPPPAGFYWFRLTNATQQVHISIDYLAGRYHPLPKELNSPAKIRETFERLQRCNEAEEPVDDDARAVLLAGLGPAYKLFNKVSLGIRAFLVGCIADRAFLSLCFCSSIVRSLCRRSPHRPHQGYPGGRGKPFRAQRRPEIRSGVLNPYLVPLLQKEARPRLEGMAAAAIAPVQDDGLMEEGPAPTAEAA